MHTNDTIISVSVKTPCVAAKTLTNKMEGVSQWLKKNHLTLNLKKTVSMFTAYN